MPSSITGALFRAEPGMARAHGRDAAVRFHV
jgi:hypothetical protein